MNINFCSTMFTESRQGQSHLKLFSLYISLSSAVLLPFSCDYVDYLSAFGPHSFIELSFFLKKKKKLCL